MTSSAEASGTHRCGTLPRTNPPAAYFGLGELPSNWSAFGSTDDPFNSKPRVARHSRRSCRLPWAKGCNAYGVRLKASVVGKPPTRATHVVWRPSNSFRWRVFQKVLPRLGLRYSSISGCSRTLTPSPQGWTLANTSPIRYSLISSSVNSVSASTARGIELIINYPGTT